jgi:hypothetical protein
MLTSAGYFSSRLLMKSFYESFAKFAKNMLEICGQDSSKADIPLRVRDIILTLKVSLGLLLQF